MARIISKSLLGQGHAVVSRDGELFGGLEVSRTPGAAIDRFLALNGGADSAGPWQRWADKGFRVVRVEIREVSP